MTYYRVPVDFDNKTVWYRTKTGRATSIFLIGNELFTEKECLKLNLPYKVFEKIQLSSAKTYMFFGARFEFDKGYDWRP